MISVVCWLWPTVRNYRSSFGAKNVNIFRNMIERNLHMEHEVVCITNIPKGIDPRVRIIPLWTDYSDVDSPHGGVSPSCYRRLKAFSPEMADVIGPRFISMDLDVCIISDITPLLQRTEDFIIWGSVLRTINVDDGCRGTERSMGRLRPDNFTTADPQSGLPRF